MNCEYRCTAVDFNNHWKSYPHIRGFLCTKVVPLSQGFPQSYAQVWTLRFALICSSGAVFWRVANLCKSWASHSSTTMLLLDSARQLSDLVVGRTTLRHLSRNLFVRVHDRGVVTSTKLLSDLWQ